MDTCAKPDEARNIAPKRFQGKRRSETGEVCAVAVMLTIGDDTMCMIEVVI